MTETSVEAHKEHLRYEQEHLSWSADHMRALAILKRAEAHLFQHEAEIAAHRAEIARHEESISHGEAHAPKFPEGEHEAMGHAHAETRESHDRLLNAISDLEKLL
jgi:hypothetical protein